MKTQEVVQDNIDVLVVGGGLAGCFAALEARKAGARKVVQLDKGRVGKTGASAFAAGVIFAHFREDPDFEDRFQRAVRFQGFLTQQDVALTNFETASARIKDMENYGVEFLRSADGRLLKVTGRGSFPLLSFRGPQMMEALAKATRKAGVEQLDRVMATGILTRGGRVVGAVGFHTQTGEFYIFRARAVVMAAGGTSYKGLMTGNRNNSGDSCAVAYKAGAILSCNGTGGWGNLFAARYDIGPGMAHYAGAGARFINAKGERIMERWNPALKERAALRLLGIAGAIEVMRGNGPMSMDMTHFTPEQVRLLKTSIPLPMMMFERAGLVVGDRFVRPIEWTGTSPGPAVGLKVLNRDFATSLPGLYASGDAAGNETFTNGLMGAATSGAIAGRSAAIFAREVSAAEPWGEEMERLREETYAPLHRKEGIEPDQVLLSVQETVSPYYVLGIRRQDRLEEALARIEDIRDSQLPLLGAYDPHYLRMAHEAQNLAFTAEAHIRSALLRTESRLALREDYPYMDNINWLKWIRLQEKEGKMGFTLEEVPAEKYPIKIPRERVLEYAWDTALSLGLVSITPEEKVKWEFGG